MWTDLGAADDNDWNSPNVFGGASQIAHHEAVGLGPDCYRLLRLNQTCPFVTTSNIATAESSV